MTTKEATEKKSATERFTAFVKDVRKDFKLGIIDAPESSSRTKRTRRTAIAVIALICALALAASVVLLVLTFTVSLQYIILSLSALVMAIAIFIVLLASVSYSATIERVTKSTRELEAAVDKFNRSMAAYEQSVLDLEGVALAMNGLCARTAAAIKKPAIVAGNDQKGNS